MQSNITFIEKPWGYEKIWAHTDKYVGKIIFIKKGHRLSLQKHEKKKETMTVLKGKMTFRLDNEDIELEEGGVIHVDAGRVHRMSAIHSDVEVCEVSTPELDDVIRLEDDYGR